MLICSSFVNTQPPQASLLMDTLTLLNNKTYHHGDAFALAQVQQHLQALEMQTESLYGLVTRLHYNGDEANQTAKLEKKRDVSCGTTKQLKSPTSSLLLHKDKACASCGKKNTNQWRKGPKGSATYVTKSLSLSLSLNILHPSFFAP